MRKRCSNCFYKDRNFDKFPCRDCITDGNHESWADAKQQMIVEELEKILNEINQIPHHNSEYIKSEYVENLILHHISELKGDNNG